MTECSLFRSVVSCEQEVQMAREDYSVHSKCGFDHIQLSSLQEKDLFSEGYRVKVLCWYIPK